MGQIFNTIITQPLGYIIKFIYDLVQNYGLAIILFTLLIRVILLPLNVKQQKSMGRTQKISPLLTEIQQKYKNDKEKQSQETMKLYKKYNVSPMGGCLPLLIQFPILIGLVQVIYKPCTYILHMAADQIGTTNQMVLAADSMNVWFLGINLAAIPDFRVASVLWIIPLLASAATYFSGKISQNQSSGTPGNEQAQQTSKMMTTMFPLMTLFFTFTMPVAASLYWFTSSALQIIQQVLLKKYVKIDDLEIDDGGTWHDRNNKKRQNG